MKPYDISTVLHTEVIEDMTACEKAKLMDELEALLQNQNARVKISHRNRS